MYGSEPRGWNEEILDGLAEGVVVFDADGTAIAANPAAEALLGGLDLYIGDPRREFVDATGAPLQPEARPAAITRATGAPQAGVVIGLLAADGRPTWIEMRTHVLGNATHGPPFAVVASGVDVTARVRAEHEARALAAELEEATAGDLPLVHALVAGAPIGIVILTPELRFVRVNDAFAAIDELPRDAHLGRTPRELLGADGVRLERRLRDVLTGGRPQTDVEEELRRPGAASPRLLHLTLTPVRDRGGLVIAVGALVRDVTDRRRAAADRERTLEGQRRSVDRAARLQWVTAALSSALSTHDVAYVLAREATAAVDSERGWVALLSEDGRSYEPVVRVGDVPAVVAGGPADAALPGPAAIRVGEAHFWASADELADRHPSVAFELRAAGLEAGAAIPITGARGVWGFLGLGDTEQRTFDEGERRTLTAITQQCGRALDRAASFEHAHVSVERLAQSLLPERLPDIPGILLATRLRGAQGPHAAVGGDFYDAFPVGPASWMLVVGDVAGKGTEAASVTALVRYTLRAEALHDGSPRRLLEHVNDAILAQRSDLRFCTVACARVDLDRDTAALTLSAAGHPDPLVLRADGTGVALHIAGSALGVFGAPQLTEIQLPLRRGDGLVLYTDGLLEAHAPERVLAPEDLLRAPVVGLPRPAPERLVDALLEAALDGVPGPTRDDVVVLAAQLT